MIDLRGLSNFDVPLYRTLTKGPGAGSKGARSKATVPYYLKRVRDPVPCLTLLKIFLFARCETVKSHVMKRKYRTISLLRRELSLFRCKTPNKPLCGVPYYETLYMYVTVKIVEVIER